MKPLMAISGQVWLNLDVVTDSYETSDMLLEWEDDDPVDLDPDLQLPQFRLVEHKTAQCVKRYKTGRWPTQVGGSHT